MKCEVNSLYRNGKVVTNDKPVAKTVIGDVWLGMGVHPIRGRTCSEASVLDEKGVFSMPEMFDVFCVVIGENGFKLRGTEIVAGKEMVQEWWCVPINS